MARYIDADIALDKMKNWHTQERLMDCVRDTPTADVVEVETIKAWLYKIAINNVGYVIDGDFSDAYEEIISRLDGLRSFAKEYTQKERGAE